MAESSNKCAHPSCNCTATKDSKFCSTYCAGQGDAADITCGCEHAGCAPVATVL